MDFSFFITPSYRIPPTIQLKQEGRIIGTAIINGRATYYRNVKGELVSQSVREPDGTVKFYDINGVEIEGPRLP